MSVVTHRRLHTGFGEDFGPRADGFVVGHTWEGSRLTVGTVAEFLAPGGPRDWQDADSVLGSYNLVICADGVVEIVAWDHASGGINPYSSGFKPRSWLYGVADRDEIHNPNQFSLQLCFFVSKAFCDQYGWPPYMIDAAARAWIEEEERAKRSQVWSEHADFQPPPNRFDCGPIATNLVKQRYAVLKARSEADMPLVGFTPIVNRRATIAAGAAVRSQPAFDRNNYDAHLIVKEPTSRTRTAVAWVTGTNLTLNDGTVFDARTRWLVTDSDSHGAIFYHERDVLRLDPIETADCSAEVAKVAAQTTTIADLKTQLATANAKIAAGRAALA